MTAHVVLAQETGLDLEISIKSQLKHTLLHKNIHHITLETEREFEQCETLVC